MEPQSKPFSAVPQDPCRPLHSGASQTEFSVSTLTLCLLLPPPPGSQPEPPVSGL